MKKKTRVFFSMENDLNEQFEQYIKEKYIDRSLLIEGLVRDWLLSEKVKAFNNIAYMSGSKD